MRTKEEKRAYSRKWYAAHKDRVRTKRNTDRRSSPEKRDACNAYARAYYKKHRARHFEANRGYRLKHVYGLTPTEVAAMLARQHDMCAICYEWISQGMFHIDHDHRYVGKGGVRGLLCGNCNRGLGSFHDDIDKMARAIAYLEKH